MAFLLCKNLAAQPLPHTGPQRTLPAFSPASPAVVKMGGVFRQAMVGKVVSLDPVKKHNEVESRILQNTQETLLSIDPASGRLIPSACEKYEVSADGLEITFTLRDHLYYSNGKRILADDFVFALKRHFDPKNQTGYLRQVSYIQGALELLEGLFFHPEKLGVKASTENGKSILRIKLVRPFPHLLYFFAHQASMPIHAPEYARLGKNYFKPGQMHSSGPFIMQQKSDSFFVFAKNRHHRKQSQILLQQVQLKLFDVQAKAEKAFLKGRVDQVGTRYFPVSSSFVRTLKGSDVLFFQPDLRTFFLRFHIGRVPSSQFKIRQALSMAIDRDEIKTLVESNQEKIAFSITPDQQHLYDPPHTYYNDISGAKNILTQMGFCLKQKDQSSCVDLPRLHVIYPKTLLGQKLALLIGSQWKKLGFKTVEMTGIKSKEFIESVNHGSFTIAIDEIAVDTYTFFDLLHAFESSQLTSTGVQSNIFDEMIKKSAHDLLYSDSIQRYRQAESFLLREASIVPLLQTTTPYAKALHVNGYLPNLWDVHKWENISIR